MKLLVITGDRSFVEGHPRFELQEKAVQNMKSVYWGPGALLPPVPAGHFDVVSVQDPFLRGLYGLLVARKMRARFNVQLHADIKAQSWWKRAIAGFVLAQADSVRAVSEKTKLQALAHGIRARVHVVPVFVDVERFRAISRTPQPHPVVLWVGRFEEEKDPFLALRVFKKVLKQKSDARLVMLGSGSLERALRRTADGLPVEFPGWQKDVAPYLTKASVLLSTSRSESWGASFVEALSAGVPVVAPDVGIAREAGATVVKREELAEAVLHALSSSLKGTLLIGTYSKEEWQRAWLASL